MNPTGVTGIPTVSPTPVIPTTYGPTRSPSGVPTDMPTHVPSSAAPTTAVPTTSPSKSPTKSTSNPSVTPSKSPSTNPTQSPSSTPTQAIINTQVTGLADFSSSETTENIQDMGFENTEKMSGDYLWGLFVTFIGVTFMVIIACWCIFKHDVKNLKVVTTKPPLIDL
eukprot:UN08979